MFPENDAVNQFAEELDLLKSNICNNLWKDAPTVLVRFSGEYDTNLEFAIIDSWFADERFDELIDYIH